VPFIKRSRRGQSYHDVRRNVATVACEKCKASVLTKDQQVILNFGEEQFRVLSKMLANLD
jgi:hypothetical protein